MPQRERKEDGMARVKEEPSRGTLAALQEMLTGSGQAIIDQAQNLAGAAGRTLEVVGRTAQYQFGALVDAVGEQLGERLDALMNAFSVSIRRDLEDMDERLELLETRLGEPSTDDIKEIVAPVRTLANNAVESAAAAQVRLDELTNRLQAAERRAAEIAATEREAPQPAFDGDGIRQHVERVDQRMTDLGREVGGKLGELGALRERLTRVEARVLESGKDQIARAGETTGLRDRLARLEARLSDLSREQVARAVEAAGLRERVFRLEQRATGGDAVRIPAEQPVNSQQHP
jgi:chromosome segregation ATPase